MADTRDTTIEETFGLIAVEERAVAVDIPGS
jgi:hypothetical protein